ncbi:uncharacterized protein LOC134827302 [Culicoides brevitarsis]|uniref:uncharacterized protein LOC134827302 n=1 Tax=Culicoides brevitarsis TaxID=469753 RepID=UPI00307C1865
MLEQISFRRVFYLSLVISVIHETVDARVILTENVSVEPVIEANSISPFDSNARARLELFKLFRSLDVRSFIPLADDEKYILKKLEFPTFDESEEEIEDDDEFDLLWFINPKLRESLTGGAAVRRKKPESRKSTKES